jgi:hypothetical protein
MHIMSEAVMSSMNISGLSIPFRSSAYLRTRKFVLNALCLVAVVVESKN